MKDKTTPAHENDPHLEERSFQQVTDIPIKATYQGTGQARPSYVPYRKSRPPQVSSGTHPEDVQRSRTTEDFVGSSFLRRYEWLRYPLISVVILYSLYAAFTGWIIPRANAMSDQWHYGDARVSHTTMKINGIERDLLGIGYKGQIEVIILPDPNNPHSQAMVYLEPQPFADTLSRYVILHPTFINPSDHFESIVVEVEGAGGVSSVLYGHANGTFQWT